MSILVSGCKRFCCRYSCLPQTSAAAIECQLGLELQIPMLLTKACSQEQSPSWHSIGPALACVCGGIGYLHLKPVRQLIRMLMTRNVFQCTCSCYPIQTRSNTMPIIWITLIQVCSNHHPKCLLTSALPEPPRLQAVVRMTGLPCKPCRSP